MTLYIHVERIVCSRHSHSINRAQDQFCFGSSLSLLFCSFFLNFWNPMRHRSENRNEKGSSCLKIEAMQTEQEWCLRADWLNLWICAAREEEKLCIFIWDALLSSHHSRCCCCCCYSPLHFVPSVRIAFVLVPEWTRNYNKSKFSVVFFFVVFFSSTQHRK